MSHVTTKCGLIVPGHLFRRDQTNCKPAIKKKHHGTPISHPELRIHPNLVYQEYATSCFVQLFSHNVFCGSYVFADEILGRALNHVFSCSYAKGVTANYNQCKRMHT